ncbi:hypothetical protein L596_024360 [Steinernema carpocapsae]|uniref:Mediator complex subunit 1 n=1 Tax=Steinernema carpocapsae TaxID=34508 RepID=A0A4U5MGI7_STECR|nr:hypothetical protein L596_024360 [Steinernema carpocapsae]
MFSFLQSQQRGDDPMEGVDEDFDPLRDFDSEEIQMEGRMDNVRQTSSGLTFAQLSNGFKKNLMEKKIVLDSDVRGQLTSSLQILRDNFLTSGSVDFPARLKMLAEVLNCQLVSQSLYHELKRVELVIVIRMETTTSISSCSIGWFQDRMQQCELLKQLLQENTWGKLEAGLTKMLQILPARLTPTDCELGLRALAVVENDLMIVNHAQANMLPMACINRLPIGLCYIRTTLSPFTIYFMADPMMIRSAGDKVPDDVLVKMPHATLCISESNSLNLLPEISQVDSRAMQWLPFQDSGSTNRRVKAAIGLKFSSSILMFTQTANELQKLGVELVYASENCETFNYFQTMFSTHSDKLFCRLTQSNAIRFSIAPTKTIMTPEEQIACVITEVRVSDPRLIPTVIQKFRQQLVYNSLMESLTRSGSGATPYRNFPQVVKDVNMTLSLEHSLIELSFELKKKMAFARISVNPDMLDITMGNINETPFDPKVQEGGKQILNLTWSLPLTMFAVLSSETKRVDFTKMAQRIADKGNTIVNALPEAFNSARIHPSKYGAAWAVLFEDPDKKKKKPKVPFIHEIESPLAPGQFSLLRSMRELTPEEKLLVPIPVSRQQNYGVDLAVPSSLRVPDLSSARSMRISTDGMALNNALSDLDAIAEMGNDDADSLMSENSGRSSTIERCSPSAGLPGFRPGVAATTPQSPSELQRRALQQSMGVPLSGINPAQMDFRMKLMQSQQQMHQQTPPSVGSSDIFDFAANEDSNGSGHNPTGSAPSSGSATPFTTGSSSGLMNPFQFPPAGSPMLPGFAGPPGYAGRGMLPQPGKRGRGRGRKVANSGDRQSSLDSLSSPVLDPMVNPAMQLPASGAGSRGGKQRGASGQRKPRKPRRGSISVAGLATPLQYNQYMAQMAGQMQRPFPDLSQSSIPPQLHPSDSVMGMQLNELDYEDESSDGETDPPPPPKSAMAASASSAGSTAPILTPSVIPTPKTAPAATSFSALVKQRSNSSSPLVAAESVQIQKVINEDCVLSKPSSPSLSKMRKSSLESLIPKMQSAPPPPSAFNDLYDDGTQSRTPSPPPMITKRESPRPSSATDSSGSGVKMVLKIPKHNQMKSSLSKNLSSEPIRMSAGQPPSSRVGKDSCSRSKYANSSAFPRPSKLLGDEPTKPSKKSSKRKATDAGGSSSGSAKKQRNSTASPTTAAPTTLPFGFTSVGFSKDFKIPKVSDESSAPPPPSSSSSSSTATVVPKAPPPLRVPTLSLSPRIPRPGFPNLSLRTVRSTLKPIPKATLWASLRLPTPLDVRLSFQLHRRRL